MDPLDPSASSSSGGSLSPPPYGEAVGEVTFTALRFPDVGADLTLSEYGYEHAFGKSSPVAPLERAFGDPVDDGTKDDYLSMGTDRPFLSLSMGVAPKLEQQVVYLPPSPRMSPSEPLSMLQRAPATEPRRVHAPVAVVPVSLNVPVDVQPVLQPQATSVRRSKRRRSLAPIPAPPPGVKRQKEEPRPTMAELAASAAANPTSRGPRRFFSEIDSTTGNVQPHFAASAIVAHDDTAWVELDMPAMREKYGHLSTHQIIYKINCTLYAHKKKCGYVVQQASRSAIPTGDNVFEARVSDAGSRKPLHMSFRENKFRVYSRTYKGVSFVECTGQAPTCVTKVFVVPSVDQDGDELMDE